MCTEASEARAEQDLKECYMLTATEHCKHDFKWSGSKKMNNNLT